jgi:hypothetical protein
MATNPNNPPGNNPPPIDPTEAKRQAIARSAAGDARPNMFETVAAMPAEDREEFLRSRPARRAGVPDTAPGGPADRAMPARRGEDPFDGLSDEELTDLAEQAAIEDEKRAYENWCRARDLYEESFREKDAPAAPAVSYKHADIFTIDELRAEIARAEKQPFLVDGYVPIQSLTLTIGNSGDGKSPLKYQQGICIAAGVPFLGLKVTPGRVLYIDFENNPEQSADIAENISRVVGLSGVPSNFRFWNANLSRDSDWSNIVPNKVEEFRPVYVVIDTLAKCFTDAESENRGANELLKGLKQLTAKFGCAVDLIHHPKKNIPVRSFAKEDVERDIQELIKDSRGAASLFQGADVRFYTRKPPASATHTDDGTCELQLLGFRRVFGTLPMVSLGRIRDDITGEELGYTRITGAKRLTNSEYAKAFADLPDQFRWKDLERAFGTNGRSKQLFKNACLSLGIIKTTGKGYEKVHDPTIGEGTKDGTRPKVVPTSKATLATAPKHQNR